MTKQLRLTLTLLATAILGLQLETSCSQEKPTLERFAEPRDVVREYCRRQMEGVQLGGAGTLWDSLAPLIAWEGVEPPDDTVIVVKDYRILDQNKQKELGVVRVEFSVLGTVDFIDGFASEPEQKVVAFHLVRKGGRWKIRDPILSPHVSLATLIKHLQRSVDEMERKGIEQGKEEMRRTLRQLKAVQR